MLLLVERDLGPAAVAGDPYFGSATVRAELFLGHPIAEQSPQLRFLNDRCKDIARRAGLDPAEWHLHRFRDTAATRWLRAGIDVRTVEEWLGHESLATTQKYLEPSKETERQLEGMKLPF